MPSGRASCPTPPTSATRARTRSATSRSAVGGLDLPTLEALGLGNIEPLLGLPAAAGRAGGRRDGCSSARAGKDTTTGHWELMGILTPQAMPTYPHGFPDEVIDPFMNQTGHGVLGNVPGERDRDHPGARRGAPADGQVDRLHERRLGVPDRRARGDDPARGAVRRLPRRARDPHRQARRRPRDRAAVHRRARELRAHAEPPRLLARAAAAELPLAHPRAAARRSTASGRSPTSSPAATSTSRSRRSRTSRGSSAPRSSCATVDDGFVFTNLVETDMLWGHRNDPENFHRCLQDFDRRLPDLLDALRRGRPADPDLGSRLRPDDAVDRPLARARAARSPTSQGRNAGGRVHEGGEFADVGATVNAWLGGGRRRRREPCPGSRSSSVRAGA